MVYRRQGKVIYTRKTFEISCSNIYMYHWSHSQVKCTKCSLRLNYIYVYCTDLYIEWICKFKIVRKLLVSDHFVFNSLCNFRIWNYSLQFRKYCNFRYGILFSFKKKLFFWCFQITHRILAAQLTGLFIEVESAKFSHHLSVILPIIQQQIDPGRYSDNVCCIKIACFTLFYHNLNVDVCPPILNTVYIR